MGTRVSYSNSSAFSRIQITMCSNEASKFGVRAGMKLSEARAVCADLLWREYDPRLCSKYQTSLVKELVTCSPRVVAREPGVFLLDAEGRKHLGGENKLCTDILRLASKAGFVHGQIGIANTAFCALVATRFKSRRWYIVRKGYDENFLSTLPISHLPLTDEMHDLLLTLGIKTMGQFASIPEDRVLDRFGEEARVAHELSRGFDLSQPRIPVTERQFTCRIELGGPIDSLNQTMFVMKSMLDKLTADLRLEALRAEEIILGFFSDDDKFDERPIKLINSSNNAKFLLEVLKLSLESQPLFREFTGIEISVSRHSKEQWEQPSISQLNKEQDEISPESLNLLLQRFITRLGEDSLVKPMAIDQYLTEKSGFWQPIIQVESSGNGTSFSQATTNQGVSVNSSANSNVNSISHQASNSKNISNSTNQISYTDIDSLTNIEVNSGYIKESTGENGLVSHLVFKKNPTPVPVMVEFNETKPAAVRYHGRWHYIKNLTAPECLSGSWWEKPLRRSYYTALLDSSAEQNIDRGSPLVMSLFHDHDSRSWFVDGIYD